MKKTVYYCDICGELFKILRKTDGMRYVGLQIHLKYDQEVSHTKRVKLHICPSCLNQIINNSTKL